MVDVGLSVFSGLGAETVPYLDFCAGDFDSIWLPDHLQTNVEGVMEGWTLLSFCAGRYPGKTVGHQVLCNQFREPAVLAKMATTAQVLTGGRFVLGIGAGWHQGEADAYGLDFPGFAERIDRLIEAIALIRKLWAGKPIYHSGRFYETRGAVCLPSPASPPPVMVGASGERHGLRAVATSADWWNHIFRSTDEYSAKVATLRRHCEDLGRDPAEIRQVLGTQISIAETDSELRRMISSGNVRSVDRNGISGTPDRVYAQLAEAIDAGASMVIAGFADSPSTVGTKLFVEQVLPRLEAL